MITPPQIAKRLSVYFRNITKFELIFHGGEPSEIWSQETNVWMLKFKETDYIEIINHLIYVWTLLDYAYLFLEWINVWRIICITKWLSFPVDSHQTMRNLLWILSNRMVCNKSINFLLKFKMFNISSMFHLQQNSCYYYMHMYLNFI